MNGNLDYFALIAAGDIKTCLTCRESLYNNSAGCFFERNNTLTACKLPLNLRAGGGVCSYLLFGSKRGIKLYCIIAYIENCFALYSLARAPYGCDLVKLEALNRYFSANGELR